MLRLKIIPLVMGLALAAPETSRGAAMAQASVPPDRGSDPEEVAHADFRSALKEGTANALCLFVRHHADHPLAARARQLLWELYQVDGTPAHPCPQANK